MRRLFALPIACCLVVACSWAKEDTSLTLDWPPDQPVIRLTFLQFKLLFTQANHNTYVSDVMAENLSSRTFQRLEFTVYVTDKDKVRIGDAFLTITDLGPSQHIKLPFQFTSIGVPAGLSLSAKKDMIAPAPGKTIPLKIISVPPGADLKVDGQPAGKTPVLVRLTVGSHNLEFQKEGFATGSTPVEIAEDELAGGSLTFELGGLSRDTVELRSGEVCLGDVISMSMSEIVLRVDGKNRVLQRNSVKKIMLVERETQPTATEPSPFPHR